MLPVNMAYAQSATEMLDPVKLAQTSGEVGTSPFVIYDVTKGKYVAQGGTAGVRCVLAESGTVFELSGHNIKTYYKTSTTGQLESYLGNGTGDDLYVNLTTAATWTFNAADNKNNRLYKLQCGGKYLQADANGNLTFVDNGGDTFVLISRAKLRSSIRSMYNNNMIDVTALIDNSRFEQKNGGKTEDKSGWIFSDPGQGAGWRWANDNMDYPKQNDYYHLIGVFDAEKEKVTLYRDGVKVGEDDAKGKYMFPKALEYQWYIIGGELGNFDGYKPKAVGGRQGLLGHNVITRLYSWPLTEAQVTSLHNELKSPRKFADVVAGNTLAYNVSYARNVLAKEGSVLPIHGTGFTADDEITLVPNISVTQAKGKVATARAAIKPTLYDKGIKLTLPALNTGNYTINLKRGDKVQSLGNIDIIAASTIAIPAIAHRGADGSGTNENSRASLRKALQNNYYGSETDVWMTKDGKLMVNHDPVRNNITIRTSTYEECKDLTIGNGEKMPTLDDFLKIMQETTSPTKLIIEIKEASGEYTYNERAAEETVKLVKQYGVEDKVEYISFSWEACLKVRELDRNAKVAFLSSNSSSDDKKTPSEVAAAGLTGIDYSTGLMHDNPGWYDQAHKLGLSVNVWTINKTSEATTERSYGADFITANNPSEVKNLYLADDVYKEYYELNK